MRFLRLMLSSALGRTIARPTSCIVVEYESYSGCHLCELDRLAASRLVVSAYTSCLNQDGGISDACPVSCCKKHCI